MMLFEISYQPTCSSQPQCHICSCILSHMNNIDDCWHFKNGKSSESVQCAITGPCLRMRHRPSANALYRFGRFALKTALSYLDGDILSLPA